MTAGAEAVARVSDLPVGSLRTVTTSRGERICLANHDGDIHAVAAVCSHQQYELEEGAILPGARLECAWHGAQFDLHTGAPLRHPALDPIAVFEVTLRDGMVCVGERRP